MSVCEHKKTEFLMRRDGVDYLRCLGCDQVFEAEDLDLEPTVTEMAADGEDNQPIHRKAS